MSVNVPPVFLYVSNAVSAFLVENIGRWKPLNFDLFVFLDKCLKWRVLPYSQSQVGREVPDNWQCRDNPDQKHKRYF